jgi:hypothetical protein
MRYKIQKSSYVQDGKVKDLYYVLYKKKVWWKKEPVWRNCREFTYASYDSWLGERVKRDTLTDAEYYIKEQILTDDIKGLGPVDIKIYECRDSKLDKILG